ncbi:hypothetical protein CDAR_437111 [Caerostris darwini]|uniref:Uncharacterized protein n=1 Tax=Caerostris darwini TaxID=1538125 RepID=A0AAV4TSC8_9ARAC|nr:hypothetical protein CDAR_437111 [Caerostris darwini]
MPGRIQDINKYYSLGENGRDMKNVFLGPRRKRDCQRGDVSGRRVNKRRFCESPCFSPAGGQSKGKKLLKRTITSFPSARYCSLDTHSTPE